MPDSIPLRGVGRIVDAVFCDILARSRRCNAGRTVQNDRFQQLRSLSGRRSRNAIDRLRDPIGTRKVGTLTHGKHRKLKLQTYGIQPNILVLMN